jgi:hypothetical protein
MDRRTFLKGLTGLGAALILPPSLVDNAEAARRFWALDRTMIEGSVFQVGDQVFHPEWNEWVKVTGVYRPMKIIVNRRADDGLVTMSIANPVTYTISASFS